MREAVTDQDVFPTVKVHIEKDRAPGPFRPGHTAIVGYFGIGAVAAIQEQRVAADLNLGLKISGQAGLRVHAAFLRERQPMLSAQHINDQKIVVAVPINVSEIDPHRKIAGRTPGQGAERAKMAVAIVDPAAIRSEGGVANIEVGIDVVVEVTK